MSFEKREQEGDAERSVTESAAKAKAAERKFFDLGGLNNEIVKTAKPEFIAKGGEHIVYGIPDHPDIVVKADIGSIQKMLYENQRAGKPPGALTDRAIDFTERFAEREAERYRDMKAYFGAEYVLNQKKFLVKVPITKNILQAIGVSFSKTPEEIWAVVMIQKRAELEGPDHFSLATDGYPEHRVTSRETYDESMRHLLYGDESLGMSGKEALMGLLKNGGEHLTALIARAEQDAELKAVLRDLVEKMIAYFEKTGLVFDVVGKDNVAVMREGGRWTYKFVDAIYPGEGGDMRPGTRQTIIDLAQGREVSKFEKNDLMNVLNFVRTANGLAEFLGSEQRINIVPDEARGSYINFQEVFESIG